MTTEEIKRQLKRIDFLYTHGIITEEERYKQLVDIHNDMIITLTKFAEKGK